jgi:predicted DNA-binding transcriptional regulator AlpA
MTATTETDRLASRDSRTAESSDLDLLKPREVAKALRTTENGLRRWRATGKGPRFIKLAGKAVRYRRADVVAWLQGQTQE